MYDMPWSRGIVVVIGCELVAEGISGASLLEILWKGWYPLHIPSPQLFRPANFSVRAKISNLPPSQNITVLPELNIRLPAPLGSVRVV